MELSSINELISKDGWSLLTWRARYGNSIFVMIGSSENLLTQISDITCGGDQQALGIESYFYNEGAWLPVVQSSNVSEALAILDKKIKNWVSNEQWKNAVCAATERIIEVDDGNMGISIAVDDDRETILRRPEGL